MDNQNTDTGKVLIVSETESFLANSLIQKLEADGISSFMSHGKIREIDKKREGIELVILFMNEDLDEMTEFLVYIKDMVNDAGSRIILIGDEDEYKTALKIIPEALILEWFKRPLDIEKLIKTIGKYLDENTGEMRKKTVLIVDDDITYMRTIYEWLKDKYRVGMASNGVQAISYLAKYKADIILLDYEMPVANGPQVLSMLKNDSVMGQIPVMFLTGHGDKESVLSVVGLNPVDYLLKTIDKNTLLSKIDTYFATHK